MPQWLRPALVLFAVGWGANQFAALLGVYENLGASTQQVTLLFGAYALGLIPALLIVAPISDRLGRRAVIRPVLVLSTIATVVLVLADTTVGWLLLGRLLAGIASGAAFAPGTAWVKELSTGPTGTGARRAAIALSAGFGTGPLVAGILAQWFEHPTQLPYLPHLVLIVTVGAIAWTAPEPQPSRPEFVVGSGSGEVRGVFATLTSPIFVKRIVPTAPAVFGAASLAFTAVPAVQPLPGPQIITTSALVALVLWTGVAIQPWGKRCDPSTAILIGLAAGVLGFLLAALAAVTGIGWLIPIAVVALGVTYGLVLVGGLTTVEQVAEPSDLATVTAVFYCLTYLGFAAPFLGTLLLDVVSGPTAMVVMAAMIAASMPFVLSTRPRPS